MLTSIDVKLIFDSVHLCLSSSANILQIADVALRVVFLLFLAIVSPSSTQQIRGCKLTPREIYINTELVLS